MDVWKEDTAVRDHKGFTLVELLVVVAIIGVISSIAVGNLVNALDKGKQKRTMSDLHSIGEAIEAYHIDHASYPLGVTDWATLQGFISPFFIKAPPSADGPSKSSSPASAAAPCSTLARAALEPTRRKSWWMLATRPLRCT